MVAARCLDERVRQLVNGTWKDVKGEDLKIIMENEDESKTKKPKANQKSHPKMVGTWNDDAEGTIYQYKKRLRREGFYLSTFLYVPGIKPDNNDVEHMNRMLKCILNDGGGNRSERGMHASSVLFSVLATCKLNGTSFYDVLCAAAGDG